MPLGGDHRILSGTQDQGVTGIVPGQTCLDRETDQHLDIADVASLLEIGPHQALLGR